MRTINYNGALKTLEFGIQFQSDEVVFEFFDNNTLGFSRVREIMFSKEHGHNIQRVPETIHVQDQYKYFNESEWEYKFICGSKFPKFGEIRRRSYYHHEYDLLVEFFAVSINNSKYSGMNYNLLRPIGKLYEYNGFVITFKNPNIIDRKQQYIHKNYIKSLINSVLEHDIKHYAIEDDGYDDVNNVDDDE